MDFDSIQKERLEKLHKKYGGDRESLDVAEVFTRAGVVATFNFEKAIVSSYDRETLLGLLPFTPVVYNVVCPNCFAKDSFEQFKSLVTSGLVVPILRAPYAAYSSELREFFLTHDHISRLEFQFYRFYTMRSFQATRDVHQQMHRLFDGIAEQLKGKNYEKRYPAIVKNIRSNMHPMVDADFEILERVHRALLEKNLEELENLGRLSNAISECRTAQGLNAGMVVRSAELDRLPSKSSSRVSEIDAAEHASADLKAMVTRGLGIKIPVDVPIDQYIELVKDYRPRISEAIGTISPGQIAAEGAEGLLTEVADINREIERIKGLRRYAVLEACVGLYRSNSFLVAGALLAASLGLAGSLLGCGTIATAVGAKVAKKKGLIPESPAVGRVKRMVARDVQPIANRLLQSYLGTSAPAINVLSLQRTMESASEKTK